MKHINTGVNIYKMTIFLIQICMFWVEMAPHTIYCLQSEPYNANADIVHHLVGSLLMS